MPSFFHFSSFFSIFLTLIGDKLIFIFAKFTNFFLLTPGYSKRLFYSVFDFYFCFPVSSVCLVLNFSSPGQQCKFRFPPSSCFIKSNSKEYLIFYLSEERNQPKLVLRLTVAPRNEFTSENSLGEWSVN